MKSYFINRCIDISKTGLGNVQPNPMVGCVIVHNNKIIGEGYHQKFGEAHAEVNAINSISDKNVLQHSSLYVNLEPCAHYGKTPPCAELIAKLKIPEVFIGTIDPFAKVRRKGIEILEKSGCKVQVGILEKECKELNRRFFTYHEKKRPYIILKWAQTKDGFIDIVRLENKENRPTWITNETARALVHKWRTEEQAIIVGKNTVLMDNPMLNVRDWTGKNPLRILINKNNDLDKSLNIFDQSQKTIVYNAVLNKCDNNTEFIKLDFGFDILPQIMDDLYAREIQSIIVEGGSFLINSFINNNLWDEARVFTGDKLFKSGVIAPKIDKEPISKLMIRNSKLTLYRNC